MVIAKRSAATIVIICFALAFYVDAEPRKRPIRGPDIYLGKKANRDVLLPGEKVNNVMDFGATPDGETDSTQAFMDAWRATCTSTVQSRLLVPNGKFLISPMIFGGPCLSPNPVTIQVVGTVLASTDISEYSEEQWLLFQDINGLKIIGGGTFNGQGPEAWKFTEDCDNKQESCVNMAISLKFSKVNNAIIQGITSLDPKGFHIDVFSCTNIRLRKLKLIAPDTSPNTDGIHISNSVNVILARNTIATGDDCVSMIHGTTNVTINRLKCGPGHGISIGSLGKVEDELEVKNIRVKDSILVGTDNGLRIKAWPGDKFAGAANEVFFSNITMENVKNPIIIDQEYQCKPVGQCKKQPSLVKIKNVHFSNIRGTTVSPVAVDLRCSRLNPCTGITLHNIDLKLGALPTMSRCFNIKPIFAGFQLPPACL